MILYRTANRTAYLHLFHRWNPPKYQRSDNIGEVLHWIQRVVIVSRRGLLHIKHTVLLV